MFIAVCAHYLWAQFFTQPKLEVTRAENGEFKVAHKLVVAEQVNKYFEIATFRSRSAYLVNWLPFADDVGKAQIAFKWEARATYFVDVGANGPLKWYRAGGNTGEIRIEAPALSVTAAVSLAKCKLDMFNIKKSVFLAEDKEKLNYLSELERRSFEDAQTQLMNEHLQSVAKKVVAHHVIALVNQGARSDDRVHTATVTFMNAPTP
jgi:hypothetical protein